jgi:Tol biopolymer transport system component
MGVILGTAAYMAPEQAKGKAVDRRADIWAFGCVLYEMLVGARAFDGEDTTEILGAIVKTEPDWKQLPKSTAPQIIALLRRCLQKDPRKRQQHIGDARIEIDETMTVPSAPGERARPASHVYAPWALAGLSAAALAVALLIGRPAGPTAVVSRVDITMPSISGEQQLVDFALSPDGRRIAYIAGPGFGSLWVRSLDDIQERQLPATEAPWHPFWSPDGRSLGFFSNGKLKRIDVDGGTPVVIADVTLGTGGTWSADGTIVYADFYVKTLWRVAATGGAPVALPTVEGGLSYAYPHFLPGGDRYLFASLFGTKGGWFIGTLDGKAPRPVQGASPTFTQFLPPNHLVYLQDGELRAQPIDIERAELTGSPEKIADAVAHSPRMVRGAFAVSAGGTIAYRTGGLARQLAWFDRQGRLLGRIGQPDMAPVITAAVSPDATRIALDRTAQNNRDVWMMEVSSGSVTRVTAHADEDGLPVWAPDGRRLAYESMRQAGFYSLFVRQLNSPQTETLLRQDADRNFWPLDWSRDGRHLLYLEAPDVMRGDIYALPMTGPDRTPIPVAATPFEEMNGAFSPDGAWVAYQTNQSGRQEIVVQAFPDAAKGSVQVSVNGGATPKWSPDGRELYFMAPDGKLMATVIAATDAGAKSEIPRSLFQTAAGYWFGIPQYDVDRQGRFLMDIGGHPAPPIRLLLNWKPGATP